MQLLYNFKATVKKVASQGAKGGSINLTLDIPLSDAYAGLLVTQNKDCAVSLDFNPHEQGELEYEEDEDDKEVEEDEEEF